MKHIQVSKFGGPEELELAESSKPAPGSGQALVKIAASGVNFIDVYFRRGLYKTDMPFTPGSEARLLPGIRHGSGRSTDTPPGCGRFQHRCRRNAAGDDRALPDALDLPI